MKPASALWQKACALARLADARVVFDVGAHTGTVTRVFLDALPDADVYAFEPQRESREQLLAASAASPRLHVSASALGEREGSTEFHYGAFSATSSRYPRSRSSRRYYRSDFEMLGSGQEPLETLDGFCARHGIERIHLLKMDTQGGELDILRGATGLLAGARIDVIVTEFFLVPHYEGAALFDAIWSCLGAAGYSLYDLFQGAYATNGQLRYGDAIFVSQPFRRAHLDSAAPEP